MFRHDRCSCNHSRGRHLSSVFLFTGRNLQTGAETPSGLMCFVLSCLEVKTKASEVSLISAF